MKITADNLSELQTAISNLASSLDEINEPINDWLDLDGQTDVESREEKREARRAIDDNIEQFWVYVTELFLLKNAN